MATEEAILIAKGEIEASEHEQVQAWQHLVTTGAIWSLPAWFGRIARSMMKEGVIQDDYELVTE